MFDKSWTCRIKIKVLLDNIPYLRDNKRETINMFREYFPNDKTSEENIWRNWRLVQQHMPELRWDKWIERQRHAKIISNKFRNLGQYEKVWEDVSHIFERKREAQKPFLQKLIEFIF